MVSWVYLLPLLKQVCVELLPSSVSVSQSSGALGMWIFAGEGGRVASEGGFWEEMVPESGPEAG